MNHMANSITLDADVPLHIKDEVAQQIPEENFHFMYAAIINRQVGENQYRRMAVDFEAWVTFITKLAIGESCSFCASAKDVLAFTPKVTKLIFSNVSANLNAPERAVNTEQYSEPLTWIMEQLDDIAHRRFCTNHLADFKCMVEKVHLFLLSHEPEVPEIK